MSRDIAENAYLQSTKTMPPQEESSAKLGRPQTPPNVIESVQSVPQLHPTNPFNPPISFEQQQQSQFLPANPPSAYPAEFAPLVANQSIGQSISSPMHFQSNALFSAPPQQQSMDDSDCCERISDSGAAAQFVCEPVAEVCGCCSALVCCLLSICDDNKPATRRDVNHAVSAASRGRTVIEDDMATGACCGVYSVRFIARGLGYALGAACSPVEAVRNCNSTQPLPPLLCSPCVDLATIRRVTFWGESGLKPIKAVVPTMSLTSSMGSTCI